MKHITLLVPYMSNLGSIDNPLRAFSEVNRWLKANDRPAMFQVELAGLSKEISLNEGKYVIRLDKHIEEISSTDFIIIPALDGDIAESLKMNQAFIPWLIRQYRCGAEIASLCVGAFLLGATGLLNGKSCSTHWRAMCLFTEIFPEANLVADRIITDECGLYTSGGAFSAANLILYIIEKFAGREAAIYCAKMFQIDMDRCSQSPFIIFDKQKDHSDELIKKAQEYIEKNYAHKITVAQICYMLALSRRNFERRFKQATSNTVAAYIQRVRIEAAKKLLETSGRNINEVMYAVGYQDTKAFREVFRRITGLSPIAYRNKYNPKTIPQY
ncbi:MAG: helix-turn-helix domain-containing protein [Thermoflavifilum sp.]|nr:helix-turn-helix domain-containing protein [Thermoflavifilum sp.]